MATGGVDGAGKVTVFLPVAPERSGLFNSAAFCFLSAETVWGDGDAPTLELRFNGLAIFPLLPASVSAPEITNAPSPR